MRPFLAVRCSLLLASCLAGSPTDAAEPTPAAARDLESRRRVEQTLDRLLSQSDAPRDAALRHQVFLFDAASQSILPRDGGALRAAAAAAPRDRLVQWIWATVPAADSGCDEASPCPERAGALARIEPGNAAAWLPPLQEAVRAKDDAAIDVILAKMAKARDHDDLYIENTLAWADAFARWPTAVPVPAGAPEDPRVRAIHMAYVRANLAAGTQLMGPLVRACDAARQAEARPERMADCARVGRTMLLRGRSLLAQRMGRAVQKRARADLSPDAEAARILDWRIAQMPEVERRDGGTAKAVTAQFEHLRATGNEQAALAHRLERVGIALEPPADWQPPN